MASTICVTSIADAKATISQATGRLKALDVPVPASEATLHQALDAFGDHIRRSALTPAVEGETQVTSPYGNTQIRTANRLKERHQDMPLSALNLNAIQAMVDYWRAPRS